jgi:hypothetical protein
MFFHPGVRVFIPHKMINGAKLDGFFCDIKPESLSRNQNVLLSPNGNALASRTIYRKMKPSDRNNIGLTVYPADIYLVRMRQGDVFYSGKAIKQ